MKIISPCLQCAFESKNMQITATISISEDDLYHFKCAKGHDNYMEVQAFKFELLFESGLCAIRDKYYMESVLSVTAALERFYEFFIKTILKAKPVSSDLITESFKTMSKQSERQIGAFSVLYLATFSEIPSMLKNKFIEFRNDVVHKGYLPNETEAIEYAEGVYNTIKFTYLRLLSDFNSLVCEQQFEMKNARRQKFIKQGKVLPTKITGLAPCFALTHTMQFEIFEKRTFKESFDFITNNAG